MEEHTMAVKEKRDSSMVVAVRLVKEGKADAFVTAGNSGAGMAAALFGLGRIRGIERPGLLHGLPRVAHAAWSCWTWAPTPIPSPSTCCRTASWAASTPSRFWASPGPGSAWSPTVRRPTRAAWWSAMPTSSCRPADSTLSATWKARTCTKGMADVAVTDGFTGNVMIKLSEGIFSFLVHTLKTELTPRLAEQAGARPDDPRRHSADPRPACPAADLPGAQARGWTGARPAPPRCWASTAWCSSATAAATPRPSATPIRAAIQAARSGTWSAPSARSTWRPRRRPRPERVMHVALNAHLLNFDDSATGRPASPATSPGCCAGCRRRRQGDRFTSFIGRQAGPGRLRHGARLRVVHFPACPRSARRPASPGNRPPSRWRCARIRPDLLHSMAFVSPLLWRGPTVVTIYDLSFLLFPERFQPGQPHLPGRHDPGLRPARPQGRGDLAAAPATTWSACWACLPDRVDVVPPALEPGHPAARPGGRGRLPPATGPAASASSCTWGRWSLARTWRR